MGLSGRDLERIFRLRLSPLYVSIHATDPGVRGRLLGLKSAPILPRLQRLIDGGIEIHGQVVVVPGINDGDTLKETLKNLRPLYPGLASLSVVPAGLTKHRDGLPSLPLVDRETALKMMNIIVDFQDAMLSDNGSRWVFPSDELLLKTGAEIPRGDYYENYPQIENGVGLIRCTLDDASDALNRFPGTTSSPGRIIWVTGRSAQPILEEIAENICERVAGLEVKVLPIDNRFLGDCVTVAGLLCGADIKASLDSFLKQHSETAFTKVFLPPDCTNPDGKLLDDIPVEELSTSLGVPVEVFDGRWERMLNGAEAPPS